MEAQAPPERDDRSAVRRQVWRAVADFQRGVDREESFARLYEIYYSALLRFFRLKGIPAEECRDLTQETFLGIYQGLDGYEHRDRFEGWLYRIAETCFLKRLRAAATAKRSAVEISRDAAPMPEAVGSRPGRQLTSMLAGERREALRRAVRELPEQMRKCLTLRLVHELSYKEIAAVLRLSEDTVKSHLFRGRKRLGERLKGYEADDGDEEIPAGASEL